MSILSQHWSSILRQYEYGTSGHPILQLQYIGSSRSGTGSFNVKNTHTPASLCCCGWVDSSCQEVFADTSLSKNNRRSTNLPTLLPLGTLTPGRPDPTGVCEPSALTLGLPVGTLLAAGRGHKHPDPARLYPPKAGRRFYRPRSHLTP